MSWQIKALNWFSVALAVAIALSFFAAVMGRLPWGAFWLLAALIALCAYVLIPRAKAILKRHNA